MSSDLLIDRLPCRRCGVLDAEVFAERGWFKVECNNCPQVTSVYRSANEAISAWNSERRIVSHPHDGKEIR